MIKKGSKTGKHTTLRKGTQWTQRLSALSALIEKKSFYIGENGEVEGYYY